MHIGTYAAETGTLLYRCFLKEIPRNDVGYLSDLPSFFGPDFVMNVFSVKKRYFSHDIPSIGALLYYCVVRCLHKEGYSTTCTAKCRLIRLFLQCIARPRNTRISFSVFQLKLNAYRIRILVITPNNMVRRMRGLAFRLVIFKKGSVLQIDMRGLAVM